MSSGTDGQSVKVWAESHTGAVLMWVCSSVGRAVGLHPTGPRFKPERTHHSFMLMNRARVMKLVYIGGGYGYSVIISWL